MAYLIEQSLARCESLSAGTIHVASAGTDPKASSTFRCATSASLLGEQSPAHRGHFLTEADLTDADLVLAAERLHAGFATRLSPAVQSKSFTLRQAAATADLITTGAVLEDAARRAAEEVDSDTESPSTPTPRLPTDPLDRLRWLVTEMNADRGLRHPIAVPKSPADDPADIPDPHVVGARYHKLATEMIQEAVSSLVASASRVLNA